MLVGSTLVSSGLGSVSMWSVGDVSFAVLAFLFFGFARAIFAHVETIEQIVHDVAEAALIGEHAFQPIEIAAGAFLD